MSRDRDASSSSDSSGDQNTPLLQAAVRQFGHGCPFFWYPRSLMISIAPMMEKTDRHFRYLMRQITRRVLLYTEMVTSGAIIHGDREYLLGYSREEHPISLQLGGDDPDELARAVRVAEPYGYDEYNLNVGCPSDRVQHANFGACLMANPPHVARLVTAMRSGTTKPVTVKHRIGIAERVPRDGDYRYDENYGRLRDFVGIVREAGVTHFTVHARVAVLCGLSPRQNRRVPPLDYDQVARLKREFPDLTIEVNGGISTLEQIERQLAAVDAVMVGRAAYDEPWIFSEADARFYGEPRPRPTRRAVVWKMAEYIDQWERRDRPPRDVLRHMMGLFAGCPGARRYRQLLSGPRSGRPGGAELLRQATRHIKDEVLDE